MGDGVKVVSPAKISETASSQVLTVKNVPSPTSESAEDIREAINNPNSFRRKQFIHQLCQYIKEKIALTSKLIFEDILRQLERESFLRELNAPENKKLVTIVQNLYLVTKTNSTKTKSILENLQLVDLISTTQKQIQTLLANNSAIKTISTQLVPLQQKMQQLDAEWADIIEEDIKDVLNYLVGYEKTEKVLVGFHKPTGEFIPTSSPEGQYEAGILLGRGAASPTRVSERVLTSYISASVNEKDLEQAKTPEEVQSVFYKYAEEIQPRLKNTNNVLRTRGILSEIRSANSLGGSENLIQTINLNNQSNACASVAINKFLANNPREKQENLIADNADECLRVVVLKLTMNFYVRQSYQTVPLLQELVKQLVIQKSKASEDFRESLEELITQSNAAIEDFGKMKTYDLILDDASRPQLNNTK